MIRRVFDHNITVQLAARGDAMNMHQRVRNSSHPRRDHENAGVIKDLVRSAAIELIPLKSAPEKLALIPSETPITITCSQRFGLERTLDLAERAVAAGHPVVPHIAARQVRDEAHLRELVARLRELAITNLHVIGGDAPEPEGSFSSAGELLQTLAGIDHGLKEIGIGCYPEGHPSIPDDALLEALRLKQKYATYMVSQLCFDARALSDWLQRMRGLGIELPLHIGLAAPMSTARLAELSVRIGVGTSVRYLTKQHGLVRNLIRGTAYRPEHLLFDLEADLSSTEAGIAGLHQYSFNQVELTLDWQHRIAGPAARVAPIVPTETTPLETPSPSTDEKANHGSQHNGLTHGPPVHGRISSLSVAELLGEVSSDAPAPGGGAVAATVAALAAALAAMAGRFVSDPGEDCARAVDDLVTRLDELHPLALAMADDDAIAYARYVEAAGLPRESGQDVRRAAIRAALDGAAEVPLQVARLAAEVAAAGERLASSGNPNLRSDACTATLLAAAAATSAAIFVSVNLPSQRCDVRVRESELLASQARQSARIAMLTLGVSLEEVTA